MQWDGCKWAKNAINNLLLVNIQITGTIVQLIEVIRAKAPKSTLIGYDMGTSPKVSEIIISLTAGPARSGSILLLTNKQSRTD